MIVVITSVRHTYRQHSFARLLAPELRAVVVVQVQRDRPSWPRRPCFHPRLTLPYNPLVIPAAWRVLRTPSSNGLKIKSYIIQIGLLGFGWLIYRVQHIPPPFYSPRLKRLALSGTVRLRSSWLLFRHYCPLFFFQVKSDFFPTLCAILRLIKLFFPPLVKVYRYHLCDVRFTIINDNHNWWSSSKFCISSFLNATLYAKL